LLAELVDRLDGIPLAIELAASRISILSPRKMLDRMSKRFDLLRGGPSDGVTRQFTLRAAFDWSWDMMSPAQQSAFAQLSAFRGGFSIEAAEAVVALDDGDVLDALEELRGSSLLSPEPPDPQGDEQRFRLYASIRDYAAERAGEMGLSSDAEVRHRDFFLRESKDRMGEFGAPGEAELRWFVANRENLLAVVHRFGGLEPNLAAEAALGLAHLMIRRGPFDAPLEMLEGVIAALGSEAGEGLRARLLFSRGVARSGTGRLEDGDADFVAAGTAAAAAGMTRLQASALLYQGLNALRQGRLPESRSLLESARVAAESAKDSRVTCRALVSMGMCLEAGADFDEASDCYGRALQLARELGDPWEEVRVRSKMGSLCSFIAGREEEARAHFEWAWERSREVGDSFIEAGTAYNLGRLNLNLGLLPEADRFLERALSSFREMGNQGSVGFVRTARGLLELERGDPQAARKELGEAIRLLRAADHRLALSLAQATDAMVDLQLGDLASAKAVADQALVPVVELKHGVLQGVVQCVRALVAARAGAAAEFVSAISSYR
jgi:predicted ATPase